MLISKIIVYVSMFFWLFPPFKNRKTDYFIYFLLLAIADPIRLLFRYVFNYQDSSFSLVIVILLVVALLKNKKAQIILMTLSLLISASMLLLKAPPICYFYISTISSITIFFIIIMRFAVYLTQNNAINLFLCTLLFYVSITVFRKLSVIFNLELGAINYTIGLIYQVLFAIAFTFINYNTKDFKLIKEKH